MNALARASNEERRTVKGSLFRVAVNVLDLDRSSLSASETDDKVALYDARLLLFSFNNFWMYRGTPGVY